MDTKKTNLIVLTVALIGIAVAIYVALVGREKDIFVAKFKEHRISSIAICEVPGQFEMVAKVAYTLERSDAYWEEDVEISRGASFFLGIWLEAIGFNKSEETAKNNCKTFTYVPANPDFNVFDNDLRRALKFVKDGTADTVLYFTKDNVIKVRDLYSMSGPHGFPLSLENYWRFEEVAEKHGWKFDFANSPKKVFRGVDTKKLQLVKQ